MYKHSPSLHDDNKRERITQALQSIGNNSCELVEYNDMLVRKLIECIKVNSKTEIMVIFKGGIETTVNVENEVSSHMDRLNDSYASFFYKYIDKSQYLCYNLSIRRIIVRLQFVFKTTCLSTFCVLYIISFFEFINWAKRLKIAICHMSAIKS